ncbi:hypothetical protein RM717_18275 [Streptomyces griseus]|uniref:Integral membrane protein n=1 Tax=Streptomyces stephensoniae TaxID=3375367 RepID=A0ABU2W3M2_9ACTN|nr:hypothetical protein [Streptomyces griseus]MDT0492457.1 hypothetical protein [Streptomyces griseus]
MDDSENQPRDRYASETALTRAIRIPVRVVVLVVVLPVRMVWDLLAAGWHALDRSVLPPVRRALAAAAGALGRGLEWLFGGTGRAVGWLIATLVLIPLRWLYTSVLTPLGHALRLLGTAVLVPAALALVAGPAWLFTMLLVRPVVGLWRYVLVPAVRYGVVVPLVWLYGAVLAPVGREIAEAAEVAWRIAGYLSRAVGRGIAWLFRHLIGVPAAWAYRTVCVPVGHVVRDALWAPARRAAAEAGRAARSALATARETVRQARRDAWHALTGGTGRARSGEPRGVPARTLGSTTTVPSAAQASETSLPGEKLVKRA